MLEDKILSKYGGSSITCNSDIQRIANITNEDPRRRYIVVSAPGARHKDDIKVTQLLVKLASQRNNSNTAKNTIDEIVYRFSNIYHSSEQKVFSNLLNRFNDNQLTGKAYLASLKAFGEEMNAKLLADSLGYTFVDPKDFMHVTNSFDNAKVLPTSYNKINNLTKTNDVLVFPGFYGLNNEGQIATFSFGGSDLTGAILSKGLKVSEYENFTDCPIYAADPRIVTNPKKIEEMTYQELRDLSYSGFSIFHQDAVYPLEDTVIPIHVRSTKQFPQQGTRIVTDRINNFEKPVLGVAYKGGFCSFNVSKSGLNGMTGILSSITSIFASKEIGVEYTPVGIDDVSVVAVQKDLESKSHPDEIIKTLKHVVGQNSSVSFYDNLGTLVVAGKGLKGSMRTMGEVIVSLSQNNIGIRSVSCGEEKRCYIFGLNSKDGYKAVNTVYDQFIR